MKKNILLAFAQTVMMLVTTCSLAQQGLAVNQQAPEFAALDQNGKTISLKNLLNHGAVVLIFYRGEWCPFCNKRLMELEKSLSQFTSRGASVVAVTPQKPEYIVKTIQKTNAHFSILHDAGLKIMKSYDVAYKVDGRALERYKKMSLDFNVINGEENSENLPVPAVYVINKQGKIVYRYFDIDYRNSAPIEVILKYL